jgi:hypothetical protein
MRWIACLGLVIGLIVSVGFGLREFSTYLFTAQEPSFKFQTVAIEGQPVLAASVRGQRGIVVGCLEALSSRAIAFQAPQDVIRVAARCQQVAQDVLAVSPTLSAAHMLTAQTSLLQEDFASAVTSLQRSGQTAPRTLWIAVRRLQLARALPEVMQPLVVAQLRADIALMFESFQGRRVLAVFYQSDRDLRPDILWVAETRPDEEQRSFLGLTRRALQGGS